MIGITGTQAKEIAELLEALNRALPTESFDSDPPYGSGYRISLENVPVYDDALPQDLKTLLGFVCQTDHWYEFRTATDDEVRADRERRRPKKETA